MVYLFAGLILLFCAPTVFLPSARLAMMIGLGVISFLTGALALTWANTVAAKFLAEHPALVDTPLNPQTSNFFGGILVMFGVGIFLAIVARYVLITMRVMTPR